MSFLDTILGWFGGADNIADKMLDAVNHGTTVINVKDGSLGSGGKAFVNYVLEEIGHSLINAAVPSVSGLSKIVNNGERTYLSKSLAEDLKENLVGADGNGGIKRSLGEISENEFVLSYKSDSLKLVADLAKEIEDYMPLFDVFTVTKKYKIFSVQRSYDEIWNARKKMKKCLVNMIKKIDSYEPGKYTKQKLQENKTNMMHGTGAENEGLKNQLAYLFYVRAWRFFNRYSDEIMEYVIKDEPQTNPAKYTYESGSGVWSYANRPLKELLSGRTHFVELMDYFKKQKQRNIPEGEKDKLINAMYLLQSTPADKFGQGKQPPSEQDAKVYLGYKLRCVTMAEESISLILPAAAEAITVNSPLMGDYALKLKSCFQYTLGEIDKIINIGAKRNRDADNGDILPGFANPNVSGQAGINFQTLLGDDFQKDAQKWENTKKSMDASINKGYLREVASEYSKAKREYQYISNYKAKYFGGVIVANDADPYVNFKNLKVKLPSRSGDAGEKEYNLAAKLDSLKDFYDDAMRNQNSIDHVTLCLRKTKQFLLACQVWNDKKKDYEQHSKVTQRERQNATDLWYKKIKDHYNELCAEGKRINKEQKQARQQQNKDWKKLLDKAYKKFPYLKRNFMKHFDEYKRMAEAFCYLGIKVDASGLTKYKGLNEQQIPADCLNDETALNNYLQTIKGDQGKDELDRIDPLAKAAKRNPWQPAPAAEEGVRR